MAEGEKRSGLSLAGRVAEQAVKIDALKAEVARSAEERENRIPSADPQFTVKQVGSSTPWYISAFFCTDALASG